MGDTITLTVAASVTQGATLTYQWLKGGVAISGATSATYTKATAATGDSGSYTVSVSSTGATTVTSSAATVTVA